MFICLEKLSHCVGRVSRLVASGVPRLGNPVRMIASHATCSTWGDPKTAVAPLLYETLLRVGRSSERYAGLTAQPF
ncbi:MAG: hypothetical protein KME40_10290 [Komarekiella atlantica HA4396-MV6]|nr:hypothetical protein [Komarekiella atlantica HA4396-MV6]